MALPTDLPASALDTQICAIDTETTGLDHRSARPVLFQYHSAEQGTHLVRLQGEAPPNVRKLMEAERIVKVIHHAPFDLRMLRYNLGISARNIVCTKVAIKLIDPDHRISHSLSSLLDVYLGIALSKDERLSDWTQELTEQQIEYAERDVKYLLTLWDKLSAELASTGVLPAFQVAMKYLPLRVELDTAPLDLSKMYGY